MFDFQSVAFAPINNSQAKAQGYVLVAKEYESHDPERTIHQAMEGLQEDPGMRVIIAASAWKGDK